MDMDTFETPFTDLVRYTCTICGMLYMRVKIPPIHPKMSSSEVCPIIIKFYTKFYKL